MFTRFSEGEEDRCEVTNLRNPRGNEVEGNNKKTRKRAKTEGEADKTQRGTGMRPDWVT